MRFELTTLTLANEKLRGYFNALQLTILNENRQK
jgi:hypothetical protein